MSKCSKNSKKVVREYLITPHSKFHYECETNCFAHVRIIVEKIPDAIIYDYANEE